MDSLPKTGTAKLINVILQVIKVAGTANPVYWFIKDVITTSTQKIIQGICREGD